ncbi:MAG: LPS export ABC transporter periplasmic protein LptC [Rhodovarius sp.]|nr:LPS export ABC transporter periplasmic protein LptC [Rhodovarius sp.]MCX7931730.1 LPS export ABC transporter periplasmic protein LptC [Rhodovarius sp.]MDW8316125.1 LPS export ABC transporter periplasmic protein LptC [Rhodovarius sp.]
MSGACLPTPRAAAVQAVPERRPLPAPSRPRRAPSAAAMARRAMVMRLLRIALPAAGLGLLALIALWPEIEGQEGRLAFRHSPAVLATGAELREPLYQGIDQEGRPFTLTAALARQLPGPQIPGQERLALLAPRADLMLTDGAWLMLEAGAGEYDRATHRLRLSEGVVLYHDGGTRFRAADAVVDLHAGSAQSDKPVQATGPFGIISGEGFALTERGRALVFTGRARAVLEGGPR